MKTRLANLWESLRTSYWFIPAVMMAGAIMLAFITQFIDRRFAVESTSDLDLLFTGGPADARTILSTIAASAITVAGVTFSITVVALATVSSQFGPRLLRNFMRDTGSQIALGMFVATFLYCLLALRTVQGLEEAQFIPHLSVTVGLGMAIASLGVLIFFIHHMAHLIQVSHVVASIGDELQDGIERLFPERLGTEDTQPADVSDVLLEPVLPHGPPGEVTAHGSGFVQAIDGDALMSITLDHNIVARVERGPGRFVAAGEPLAAIWPRVRVDESLRDEIEEAFILGPDRSPTQDIELLFDDLVEIALRALSPSINDPHTANDCIEWLTTGLLLLAQRCIPSRYRYDEHKALRVIAMPVSFCAIVELIFSQLRPAALDHRSVMLKLLDMIERLEPFVEESKDRNFLIAQAFAIEQASQQHHIAECDQAAIRDRYRATIAAYRST